MLRRFSQSKFYFDFEDESATGTASPWLRRFSQSKFYFDFEDDFATGTASPSLLVPLFAKNSRLGYFFYANNLTQI
jgi:hypothetical protein